MRLVKENNLKNIKIGNRKLKLKHDWNIDKLDKITEIKDGTHDSPKYVKNGIPFITSKNLKNNKIDFENVKYISKKDHEKFYKRSNAEKGDILFGMIGTIGNPVIVNTNLVFSIKNVALIKDNKKINNHLIKYQLEHSKILKKQFQMLSQGGVLSFIKLNDIRKLKFLSIPIEEQNKIAKLLSDKENHINNLEKLIEKLEKRNQYYANKLLTGELRVKEDANGNIEFYKNPEDNWKEEKVNGYLHKTPMKMPKDWKINLASSYSRFIVGTPLNSKFFNFEQKGLQYLRTADVWEDASSKKEKAFYDGKNIESKFIKNENDFIISLKGYNTKVGQGTLGLVTSFENKKGIICDNMYVVKSIDKISLNDYTSFVFKNIYIQNLIIRCAVGSTARFSTKMINKIEWIFPCEEKEMLLMNKVFKNLNDEIYKIRKTIKKEKKQFEWLSEKLLSGEYSIDE